MRLGARFTRVLLSIAGVLLAGLSLAHALKAREETSRFDGIAIPDPSVVVSPATLTPLDARVPESVRAMWSSFKAANGGPFEIHLDARSGAPQLVQGPGIPFVPGSGNTLKSVEAVTLESLAASLRSFVARNAGPLVADDKELVLNGDPMKQTLGRLIN